jgi:hypothetical protein
MQIETHIESLMDRMHQAILAADFPNLGLLSPELEAALETLPAQINKTTLLRLRHKAERNAKGAQAASRGVRAAIRRLEEVKQNANGLVTYDEKGQRNTQAFEGELTRRF